MTPTRLLAVLLPLLFAAGCERPDNPPDDAMEAPTPAAPAVLPTDEPPDAAAVVDPDAVALPAQALPTEQRTALVLMQPTEGNTASGELRLTDTEAGVRIAGTLHGVAPGSTHGFHVHETGDCSAPDASSAGGHFAPQDEPHGDPDSLQHHAGDMPNQQAGPAGDIEVDVLLDRVELGSGGPLDIAGRALILHAQADDYTTQPAGDAGARIACGVITLAPLAE